MTKQPDRKPIPAALRKQGAEIWWLDIVGEPRRGTVIRYVRCTRRESYLITRASNGVVHVPVSMVL